MELGQSQSIEVTDASSLTRDDVVEVNLTPILSKLIYALMHRENDPQMDQVVQKVKDEREISIGIGVDGYGYHAGFYLERGSTPPGPTVTLVNMLALGLFAKENSSKMKEDPAFFNSMLNSLIKSGSQEDIMKYTHGVLSKFQLSHDKAFVTLRFKFN